MNQPSNHPNQTQTGSSFPSHQSSQTNPFTADLKGEFTSNFGTNTNAVSQIFKDGGFTANNNTKYILIGVAVLLLLAMVWFFMDSGEPTQDDIFATDPATDPLNATDPKMNQGTADPAAIDPSMTDPNAQQASAVTENQQPAQEFVEEQPESLAGANAGSSQSYASGGPALISPIDGDSRSYDETKGPATFTWEGGGGTIQFSRNRSMSPLYMSVPVSGSSYAFYNPYPGTWYWRVVQDGAASETRSFYVEPAVPRNIVVSSTGAVAGEGGTISWTGDSMVAFYRVELSADGNWANPSYRFASATESVKTTGVAPGAYQMRVGAFSEIAGRWEYSQPVTINVQ